MNERSRTLSLTVFVITVPKTGTMLRTSRRKKCPPHAVVDCSTDTSCLGFSHHVNKLRPTINILGHEVVATATGDARGNGRIGFPVVYGMELVAHINSRLLINIYFCPFYVYFKRSLASEYIVVIV